MKSKFVLDEIFQEIWDNWPNKVKEHSARKAYDVFCKSEEDVDQLQRACRIYVLDSAGDEFHYQLDNFIRNDTWKDILESGTSLDKLEQERKECIELIETWNKSCRPHWIKSDDIEDKIPTARKALQNKYFKENWRKALDKISLIFEYKFRSEDHRSRIILSFRWFSRCLPEKHTVIKAMEGEFGYPSKSERKSEKNYKEISPEARQQAVSDFYEVFSDFKKPKKKREWKSTSNPLDDLVGKLILVNESPNQINPQAPEVITPSNGEDGKEDDPFALS